MQRAVSCLPLLSCLLLLSCGTKPTPPVLPTPVNLDTVQAQPVVYYDRYPATTQALSQVNLLPQVQGYVTGIYFKEGTHVKKGDKLYEIDRRSYEAAVNAAEDAMKVTQGNLTQAQQDAERYTYLNNNKAVAKQLYDHAVIALQNAKSQLSSSAESLRTARLNLSYSVITAPFDGTIGFSQVKLGNLVTVGQTVLNTISTDDPFAVDFLINEKQLPYFEKIQNGAFASMDSLFTLILPNKAFYNATGKISVIDRAVDPQTGSIRTRLVFPNKEGILRAGMSCVVRVRNEDTQPQLLVPSKAVVEQMGEFFVYLAKDTAMASGADTAAKGKKEQQPKQGLYALQKKVQTGETIGANVIIKSGIAPGNVIVLDGVQSLHDGSQITASNKQAADNAGKGNGKK